MEIKLSLGIISGMLTVLFQTYFNPQCDDDRRAAWSIRRILE